MITGRATPRLHYKGDRLKPLRAFCQVARLGSVSRAAEALNISQSALSRQLQALEDEMMAIIVETAKDYAMPGTTKGIEIIEGLRGHTTGYAVPQFVIDAPGGGGKVPINPGYILYHDNEKIVIRNYEGKIFEYPETGNENLQFAPQREYHDEYLYS